ncbi:MULTISPECIES: hypothetical protein [Caproicibacterium]|uniref:Uncharacterized protein n=1 Tax=Caproicibacterium argilliputei TaxID=3030016 RepID=A0AA97D871_9FIRM|nr:hypothetical protein [Caproicibacterium argilliputei]WOC32360.1 hypothetical protein PXC00_00400 [Caproicibacterium argilliputei]
MDISIHGLSPHTVMTIDQMRKAKSLSRSQFLVNLIDQQVDKLQFTSGTSSDESRYTELLTKVCQIIENNTAALTRQDTALEKLLYELEAENEKVLPTNPAE